MDRDRRDGDWFFLGAIAMLIAVKQLDLTPTFFVVAALAVGWVINSARRKCNA